MYAALPLVGFLTHTLISQVTKEQSYNCINLDLPGLPLSLGLISQNQVSHDT